MLRTVLMILGTLLLVVPVHAGNWLVNGDFSDGLNGWSQHNPSSVVDWPPDNKTPLPGQVYSDADPAVYYAYTPDPEGGGTWDPTSKVGPPPYAKDGDTFGFVRTGDHHSWEFTSIYQRVTVEPGDYYVTGASWDVSIWCEGREEGWWDAGGIFGIRVDDNVNLYNSENDNAFRETEWNGTSGEMNFQYGEWLSFDYIDGLTELPVITTETGEIEFRFSAHDKYAAEEHWVAFDNIHVSLELVPEPGSLVLLASGLGGVLIRRRRK